MKDYDTPKQVNLKMKPKVSDLKTQKILDEIYKGQNAKSQVGNGTMMDAIRNERKTGKPTRGRLHTKKGKAAIKLLNACLGSGKLDDRDKAAVRAIMDDLKKALSS